MATNLALHVEHGTVAADAGGTHDEVGQLHLGNGGEIGAAEDSRQAEHILRLQETAVAVAIDLYGHDLLGGLGVEEAGDVERSGVAGILGEADIVTVDPQVEEGIHPIEIDVHRAPGPPGRHGEGAAVRTHFVGVLVDGPLRIAGLAHDAAAPVVHGHLVLEDHFLVDIDGHAVFQRTVLLDSLYIPAAWHFDVIPGRHIVGRSFEALGTLLGLLGPVELPGAVEALPIGTTFGHHLPCSLLRGEMESPRARLFLIQRQLPGRLPLLPCGSSWLGFVCKTFKVGCLGYGHRSHQKETQREKTILHKAVYH